MLFSKHHIWIDENDGMAKIGITDYAQKQLRNVLFINLPEVDDEFSVGDTLGDIESAKTVVDLLIPVSGIVKCVNEGLIDEPDVINEAPYDSWFIELKITDKADDLMTESEYDEYIKHYDV